jgi:hypothetical protein
MKVFLLILFLSQDGDIVGSIDGGPGPNTIQCHQAVPLVLELKKDQIPEGTTSFPVCIDVEQATRRVAP